MPDHRGFDRADQGIEHPSVCSRRYVARMPAWRMFAERRQHVSLSRDPAWLAVLAEGRGHTPYCIEVANGDRIEGVLPLALVSSRLFGRYLVGLPHLSQGGVDCDTTESEQALIDAAIELADSLDVEYLELRHEQPLRHDSLESLIADKVHMRLLLPETRDQLWSQLGGKVRNQIRKAERLGFRAEWGGRELLNDFYKVYSHRMRDLGSPVDGLKLFDRILQSFPQRAEVIVVHQGRRLVAAAMLLHGQGLSEIHRSGTLTAVRQTAVNSWLHWEALLRAQSRGQRWFELGCPTRDSNVYIFKRRFGAEPYQAAVQHYIRRGGPARFRQASGRYRLWINLWRYLPVSTTRWLGPKIAHGIP